MNKFKKSQILILSLVAALLFIAPLLSSSLRPTYLYFVLNLLIIALGAEAGLLSVFSRPSYVAAAKPVTTTQEIKAGEIISNNNNKEHDQKQVSPSSNEKKKVKVIEKSASEKISAGSSIKVEKVKKCPSTPSLFFIGSAEEHEEDKEEEKEEEERDLGELSGSELFTKAETFIGNFYKQLKMQREESWKRIHGFYQKAF
ncbi:hypothetical protein COLO4_09703 [Corchorus olitorius]|uniref:DUF4408 domain-containing protein n=1 Tax=Corchorus olitorius TaxID=93759 RepID=A0A1R3KBA3_9ROSI|nr:hypothetical protein COLO4_09703 [Corchorus olitorius]